MIGVWFERRWLGNYSFVGDLEKTPRETSEPTQVFLDLDGEAFKYVLIWLRHQQLVPISEEMAARIFLVAKQMQMHTLCACVSSQMKHGKVCANCDA